MPTQALTADEIITQGFVRMFFQLGGPYPNNPLLYYGTDWQYAFVQGGAIDHGSIDAINLPDPLRLKAYRLVGRSRSAPDLPSAQLLVYQKHGIVPRDLGRQGCNHNIYVVAGNCRDLSDPLNGWSDYVQTYARGLMTGVDYGDVMGADSDDALMDTYDMTLSDIYRTGQLTFGEVAAAPITREALDAVWGGGVQCGGCGPADNGATHLYTLTTTSGAGSPGMPAEVIHTRFNVDGSQTTAEYNITGLPINTAPTGIDIMGQYLVVLVNSEDAIYYATLNSLTGAPGTWTKVTTGFTATFGPLDIFVVSSSRAFIVGDGGYVYLMQSPTTGVSVVNAGVATAQNLNRVHGDGNRTLVAAGAAGAIIISSDGGTTWAAATATPSATAVTAVAVKDAYHFWVGNSAGARYYTLDRASTWTTQSVSGATAITDIVFANDEVGYTIYTASSGGQVQATQYAGALWADTVAANSRLGTLPTQVRLNRAALPRTTVDVSTAVLGLVGLATGSTDGILIVGNTPVL